MFAYGPADATASQNPSLASFKSRLVLPFWYQFTQVVLEKRLLNGCSVVVVHSCLGNALLNCSFPFSDLYIHMCNYVDENCEMSEILTVYGVCIIFAFQATASCTV